MPIPLESGQRNRSTGLFIATGALTLTIKVKVN